MLQSQGMQILFAEIVLSWLLLIIMFLLPGILELFSSYRINNAVTFIHFSMPLCMVQHQSAGSQGLYLIVILVYSYNPFYLSFTDLN